jgi:FixJ family two-component response regulator
MNLVTSVANSAMAQHSVAVIEDDPSLRKALARLLSVVGYRVEAFASAEDFLNAADASKADCLLVDVNLGEISGLDLVRRLTSAGCKLPTVFMTGSKDDTVQQQCIDLGCVAFLRKPVPESILMKAVARAIQSVLHRG